MIQGTLLAVPPPGELIVLEWCRYHQEGEEEEEEEAEGARMSLRKQEPHLGCLEKPKSEPNF